MIAERERLGALPGRIAEDTPSERSVSSMDEELKRWRSFESAALDSDDEASTVRSYKFDEDHRMEAGYSFFQCRPSGPGAYPGEMRVTWDEIPSQCLDDRKLSQRATRRARRCEVARADGSGRGR